MLILLQVSVGNASELLEETWRDCWPLLTPDPGPASGSRISDANPGDINMQNIYSKGVACASASPLSL